MPDNHTSDLKQHPPDLFFFGGGGGIRSSRKNAQTVSALSKFGDAQMEMKGFRDSRGGEGLFCIWCKYFTAANKQEELQMGELALALASWLVTGRASERSRRRRRKREKRKGGGARSPSCVWALVLYRSFSSLVTRLVIRPHSSPTRKRTHTLSVIISRM